MAKLKNEIKFIFVHYITMTLLTEKSETDQIFSMQLWSLMLCNHIFYIKATTH